MYAIKQSKTVGLTLLLVLILAGTAHDLYQIFLVEAFEVVEFVEESAELEMVDIAQAELTESEVLNRMNELNKDDLIEMEIAELSALLEYAETNFSVITPDVSEQIRDHIGSSREQLR